MSSIFKATDAGGYEQMMGRWSRILAQSFLEFAGIRPGWKVLDLGCGTGSLTKAVADQNGPGRVVGTDISAPYVEYARARISDPRVSFTVSDATHLNFADNAFDAALSMLVLNFVPEFRAAAKEMLRVTRPGGTVAAAVWDMAGGLMMSRIYWDTAACLDPAARASRGRVQSAPLSREGELSGLFREIGLVDVQEQDLLIRMRFSNFGDYWTPFLSGQGPVGYMATLDETQRERFREALFDAYCGGSPDGPRSFVAVACAVRGRSP
jgi:SAM-dependent methyltransferase